MTSGGITPLMLAAKVSNQKAVELLLNESANPFLKDQLGQEAKNYKISIDEKSKYLTVDLMSHDYSHRWTARDRADTRRSKGLMGGVSVNREDQGTSAETGSLVRQSVPRRIEKAVSSQQTVSSSG